MLVRVDVMLGLMFSTGSYMFRCHGLKITGARPMLSVTCKSDKDYKYYTFFMIKKSVEIQYCH